MRHKKEHTYLVLIGQCDDEPIIRRMTGIEICDMVSQEKSQTGIAIIDGTLLKSFDNKIDITKL